MSTESDLYRELFDLSPTPDAVFDRGGLCQAANQAFLVTFGYREEELRVPGIHFKDLFFHAETGQRLSAALFEKRIIRRREVFLQTRDEIGRTMLFSGRVLDDGCFETSFVDVSRMKSLQHDMQDENLSLAALIESMTTGVFLVDRDGKITVSNPFLAGLLGMEQEKLNGKKYHVLFQQIISRAVEPAVAQQALSQVVVQVQEHPVLEISIKSGELKYLELSLFPVWDARGTSIGWGGLVQDVSEEHDRMDWKMDLLSMLAHDLRTPLAALKGHATALLGNYRSWGSGMVLEFLQAINRSTDQLIQQVDHSLALTRVEAGKMGLRPEAVDVHQIVTQALERMGSVLEAQQVEVVFEEPIPDVRVDSARVEEVLINLLDNAVHHAPSKKPVRIEVAPAGDKVQVAVTDHGPGIPPEKASLIFQQYERLQQGEGGSGLGLYICRRIVDAHGGHIWLEERPDGKSGARFVFTLPVMPEAANMELTEEPAAAVEQPADGEAFDILVVEDEPEFQTLYYTILSEYGYHVEIAADGPTAVDRIMSASPDLVILDWLLPGMDGINVLRGIRRWSQTPILLVTSRTSQKDLVTALDAGADDYLTKPFQSDELLARIRALLRRSDSLMDLADKNRYSKGVFSIDFDSRQAWIADQKIRLSPTEFQILAYLVHNRGQVLTYDQIVNKVWGDDPARGRQDLFVHVSRLRRKLAAALKKTSSSRIRLKPQSEHRPLHDAPASPTAAFHQAFIETRWGVGYLFPAD